MRRGLIYSLIGIALLLVTAGTQAQQLPKSVAIGSNPPGSLFYALGSGLAKVISDASPIQAQVQPYAGTSTFVPLFDTGELDFGVVNAVDMGMVYQRRELQSRRQKSFSPCRQLASDHARLAAAQQLYRQERFADQNHRRR